MLYAVCALLLCLSWLQPLHLLPWVSWHSEVLAFFAVLLLSSTLIRHHWQQKLKHVRFPVSGTIWILMILVVVLQTASGLIPFFGDSLILIFYLSLCLMTTVVAFNIAEQVATGTTPAVTPKLLLYFAKCVVAVGVCSVFISLVQTFDIWPTVDWIVRPLSLRRPGANFAQPNHLATFLLMAIASLVYLFESKECSKPFSATLLALLILGLAITESRSGLLSFSLLAVWWFMRCRKAGFHTSPFVVLSACAGLFFLVLIWPPFFTLVQEGGWTDGIYAAQLSVSAGTRLIVWPQLIEAAFQRPWYGWGLREVSTAHNAVLHSYIQSEPFKYAHNIVLDLAVGIGLPMTFLVVGAVFLWMMRRLKLSTALLPWYCIALILPMGVHSMLEFPFAYAYLLVPVMLAVGVLERSLFATQVILVPRLAALSGLLIAGFMMFWSVIEYVKIEEDFRIARFEALRIGDTPSNYERPKIHLLTQLDALLEGSRLVPSRDMSTERIELSRKVAMRFPWTAVQNRYALSLALNGQQTEAIRQLKVMRAMHGEKNFDGILMNWRELTVSKYPELKAIVESLEARKHL